MNYAKEKTDADKTYRNYGIVKTILNFHGNTKKITVLYAQIVILLQSPEALKL